MFGLAEVASCAFPFPTRHSAAGGALVDRVRSSTYRLPPAQAGSGGSGSDGAPGTDADDHRVATGSSLIRCSAHRTRSEEPRVGKECRSRLSPYSYKKK